MMEPTRVVLIVDHPARDLGGLTLVAWTLAQRGIRCFLVPHNTQQAEVFALRPAFVLLNFARRGTEGFARSLAEAGIRFGVLDTEGAVWASPAEYGQLLWQDPALLALANPVCVWGPCMQQYLVSSGFVAKAATVVTGCPRFDFYADAWVDAIAPKAPPGEAKAPGLLLNTNCTFTNSRFASLEANARHAQRDFGWSDEVIANTTTAERIAIEGVIALAAALGTDFPDRQIVVRPHPFERTNTYAAPLAGYQRVEVCAAEPVQSAILGAAAVIQRSCTTAIECGMAGVPTFSPQWLPTPAVVPMAEDVSVPCRSYPELRAHLDRVLAGDYTVPIEVDMAIRRVTRDWFHLSDGRAHERVADAVEQVLWQGGPVDADRCRRALYGLDRAGEWTERASRRLRHTLRLSPLWSFRRWRRVPLLNAARPDKRFGPGQVAALVARLEACRARSAGRAMAVEIKSAQEEGAYADGFVGDAVAIVPRRSGAQRGL